MDNCDHRNVTKEHRKIGAHLVLLEICKDCGNEECIAAREMFD